VKRVILAAILLAIPALAADTNQPLPQETQLKLLKAQRQMQQIRSQMGDLQRQYDQAVTEAKDLQAQMGNDCAAAAKAANVDLSKFTCDLDTLTFAPRSEDKKAAEKK
jgi:phage host-nuclease inhibitor protein Gam